MPQSMCCAAIKALEGGLVWNILTDIQSWQKLCNQRLRIHISTQFIQLNSEINQNVKKTCSLPLGDYWIHFCYLMIVCRKTYGHTIFTYCVIVVHFCTMRLFVYLFVCLFQGLGWWNACCLTDVSIFAVFPMVTTLLCEGDLSSLLWLTMVN